MGLCMLRWVGPSSHVVNPTSVPSAGSQQRTLIDSAVEQTRTYDQLVTAKCLLISRVSKCIMVYVH